jgi:hypothetical protein
MVVHCDMGANRSPSVAVAIMHYLKLDVTSHFRFHGRRCGSLMSPANNGRQGWGSRRARPPNRLVQRRARTTAPRSRRLGL